MPFIITIPSALHPEIIRDAVATKLMSQVTAAFARVACAERWQIESGHGLGLGLDCSSVPASLDWGLDHSGTTIGR